MRIFALAASAAILRNLLIWWLSKVLCIDLMIYIECNCQKMEKRLNVYNLISHCCVLHSQTLKDTEVTYFSMTIFYNVYSRKLSTYRQHILYIFGKNRHSLSPKKLDFCRKRREKKDIYYLYFIYFRQN